MLWKYFYMRSEMVRSSLGGLCHTKPTTEVREKTKNDEHLASNHGWGGVLDLPPLLRPASWATTGDQIRAYYGDPLDMTKTELSPEFLQQLNRFSDELGQTMDDQVEKRSLFADMLKGIGLTLSTGIVAWLVRGGTLLAGLMASLPAWRHFDPVPILGMGKKDKEAWTRRVKEAAKMEARDHQGLEQILQRQGNEPPSASSESTTKSL